MRVTNARRAFSLVEILVVIVIIAVIAAVMMPRIAGYGRTTAGKATTPMAKAKDTVCISNLQQVRTSIEAYKTTEPDGKAPSSLDELKLPSEVTHCVVSNELYKYDAETGRVHCPYPGHTSY